MTSTYLHVNCVVGVACAEAFANKNIADGRVTCTRLYRVFSIFIAFSVDASVIIPLMSYPVNRLASFVRCATSVAARALRGRGGGGGGRGGGRVVARVTRIARGPCRRPSCEHIPRRHVDDAYLQPGRRLRRALCRFARRSTVSLSLIKWFFIARNKQR